MGIEVITSEGAQLLRDAKKASKNIVFTRAVAGSNYDMDGRGDLAVKPLEWYNGAVGVIDAVNPREDGVLVRAKFSAIDNTDTPIKAVCILAQLKKSGLHPTYDPEDDVIFAAWCDDNALYTSAKACSRDFDLPINLVDMVDKSGSIGDYMTTNTDQQVSGVKSYSDDGTTTTRMAGAVDIFDAVETNDYAISLTNTELSVFPNGLNDGESMTSFEWSKMPLSATFNTETSKIEFVLGDGRCFEVTVDAIQEI